MKEFKHIDHARQSNENRLSERHFHNELTAYDYYQGGFRGGSTQPILRGDCSSLPPVEVSGNINVNDSRQRSAAPTEFTIKGRNGHTDTVSGITPMSGESVEQLIKRLHPSLSAEQLAHEVKQVLKYNHDYGNDLGNGSSLDPSHPVFLTSVKFHDAQGRINRIEGPTGRLTEINYGSDGSVAGYRITSASGQIEEQVSKNDKGQWALTRGSETRVLKNVDIDPNGDLIATDAQGNQIAHLSSGTDVNTSYDSGRPTKSVAMRKGEETSEYLFEYEGNSTKVFVIDKSNPSQKVLLNQQESPEVASRLALALGQGQHQESNAANIKRCNFDVPTDNFVASRLIEAGQSLLGQPVTNFDSSIPTRVGCARMVSQALVGAGFDHGIVDANVDNLECKLKTRGFVEVSENNLKPGDIIIATGPGADDGHTGIYQGNGKVLNNSSSRGVFSTSSYEGTFGGFSRRVGYRYEA
jgi:hypothetical protein